MKFIKYPGSKKYPLFLLFALILFSCGHHKIPSPSGVSDDLFTGKLKTLLKPIDTSGKKHIGSVADNVRYTYQLDGYQPIWIKKNYSSNDAATKLIGELEDMRWDGIDPERYHLSAIKKLKEKLDTSKHNSLNDALAFDTALTHNYLAAAKDLLIGIIAPKKADSLWFHVNDTSWNAPQLLTSSKNKYPTLDDFRSFVPTYTLLRNEYKRYYDLENDTSFIRAIGMVQQVKHPDAEMIGNINTVIRTEMPWVQTTPNDTMSEQVQLITAYQTYSGIQPTGKLDSNTLARLAIPPGIILKKLGANMERIRWMQQEFGSLYLVVDVPLMELFLRKDGINVMHMRVVVGKPERQTPSLFATMDNVVINPPWDVPPTILKNDVLPGLEKSGKTYMAKKGLKVYDKEGNIVKVSTINANNYKRYTYKQNPGDDNSLGYVKFNLPNPWDIFLHDTPHRGDFPKRYRALSSGCIRLQQPQEMAIYILSQIEKKYYTQGKLDTLIETHKTRWEILKTKIPVHITYLTAFEDTTGMHIQFTKDIYQRDDKLISLLN
ncbi:MAG: L,D-transpeptidase family protein [Chitinophagales bacterium]